MANSTNDIVINKLTQILSYLRAGKQNKKKKKDKYQTAYDNDKLQAQAMANESKKSMVKEDIPIYDDVGDYVPSVKKDKENHSKRSHRESHRDHHRDSRRDRDYDRHRDHDRDRHRDRDRDRDRHRDRHRDRDYKSGGSSSKYFDKEEIKDDPNDSGFSGQDMLKKIIKREEEKSKREEAAKVSVN